MAQQKNDKDTRQEQLQSSMLAILDTAMEGAVEFLKCLSDDDAEGARMLLGDLKQVASAVASVQDSAALAVEYGNATEQLENIVDTLDEMESSLAKKQQFHAAFLAEYQLLPFTRLLKETFYFWGSVYPDQKRMEHYYAHEFAEHYQCPYFQKNEPSRYQISIVVSAYNHVEVTKHCIEHILKYADFQKLNAELVLIDHGSSDETLEFFRTIPNAKVIHFEHNVRMYMFAAIPLICEGKYVNFISNDILVTKNWAKNLITCMESDPRIAAAIPMTPNISNLQMLHVPSNDPEEFVQWADKFNHSDPRLWSDRARLMPPTCIYRMSALCEIGLADPYFYSMEFWDDDFSLRARRKGYRQVLCEDTACYHFGSVTSNEAKEKEGTLQYGRDLFRKKNHLDAWGTGFCYDYTGVQIAKQFLQQRGKSCSILGIDCGFGDTPLQIRNELRRQNCAVTLYNLTTQRQYAPDLQPLSDRFQLSSGPIHDRLLDCFAEQTFDLIYLGREMGCYEEIEALLDAAHHRLAPGGFVLFRMENPWYILNLHALLQLSLPQEQIHWVAPASVRAKAEKVFTDVQVVPIKREIQGTDGFVRQHFPGQQKAVAQITERLCVCFDYFVCSK